MSFCVYNEKNITQWHRYEFYFLMAKTIFYSLTVLIRKILFCHSKIKCISSHPHITSSIYHRKLSLSVIFYKQKLVFHFDLADLVNTKTTITLKVDAQCKIHVYYLTLPLSTISTPSALGQ